VFSTMVNCITLHFKLDFLPMLCGREEERYPSVTGRDVALASFCTSMSQTQPLTTFIFSFTARLEFFLIDPSQTVHWCIPWRVSLRFQDVEGELGYIKHPFSSFSLTLHLIRFIYYSLLPLTNYPFLAIVYTKSPQEQPLLQIERLS
jgi:hypothetical protein